MKTICILTYERTGSGWLSYALGGVDSISIHELFGEDPLLFILNLKKVLNSIYKVNPDLLSTIYKIYDVDNFFIENDTYKKIKQKILSKHIYNMDLFLTLRDICISNNYNFIFKLFNQHIKNNNLDIKNIIDLSNYIILNYRSNVLKTFISLELAKKTGVWYSKQNREIRSMKLSWKEQDYLKFYYHTQNIIRSFQKLSKNNIQITYEEIHENPGLNTHKSKIDYLFTKLHSHNININVNYHSYFDIQNNKENINEYIELFENPDDFNESLKTIPITVEI